MSPETRKVVFARVNRRQEAQLPLFPRSFREDMATLAQSHRTSYFERKNRQDISPARIWYAADMDVEPDGDFLTGTLGYTTSQQHIPFDTENWSWIKGTAAEADAAREDTIAPFAIDLRDQNRWVSFAPTARIQPSTFTKAFQRVLNNAVAAAGLIPLDWEVDLVVSPREINSWIEQHPEVYNLQRTVKFTNPGRDYDDDRREMRALAARRKREEFRAPNNGVLNIYSEEFRGKLHGTETGDIELVMHARRGRGSGDAVFTNKKTADWVSVFNFGGDLVAGTEVVLAALREYVSAKLHERG